MTSLYDTLGVPPDADDKTIRKAYRRRAKETHPDSGGDAASAETFGALVRAYEILSDPDRRKRYDETGDEGVKPPPVEERAHAILAQIFDHLLKEADEDGLVFIDIIAEARKQLRNGERNVKDGRDRNLKEAARWTRLRARVKGGILETILDRKAQAARRAVEAASLELAAGAKAIELLKDYRHTPDERPTEETITFFFQSEEEARRTAETARQFFIRRPWPSKG